MITDSVSTDINFDDDIALRLKRLTVNQLASIGIVRLVNGKSDEIICPHCGNGAGDSRTGLKPLDFTDYTKFHCFKCGHNFDNLDLFAMHFNLDISRDFREILRRADILSQNISAIEPKPKDISTKESVKNSNEISPDELTLIQADIAESQKHLEELLIEDRRGLKLETLNHFRVGFLRYFIHPKSKVEGKKSSPSPRMIIPSSDSSYNAILVNSARTPANRKYKSMSAGKKQIFNSAAIVPDEIVIVVEGEIDAMSIWQAMDGKVNVCALGGAGQSNLTNFFSAINPAEYLNYKILILFDNDETGKTNSAKLVADLVKLGVPAVAKFLSDDDSKKIDANDILISEGAAALKTRIDEILADSKFDDIRAKLTQSTEHKDTGDDLQKKLQEINKKIEDFDAEKDAAIELLQNVETFDSETVFDDKIVNAAAFAKNFDRKSYSDFIRAVKLYGNKHPAEKAGINDLKATIKDDAADINAHYNELRNHKATITGKIQNKKFIASNPDFLKFKIPDGYSLSQENGLRKIIDKKGNEIKISECPVVIAGKTKSVDEKKFKLILQLWTRDNKRRILPPYPASTVFNARKIIELADDGLAVSTLDAADLTAYLNAFNVENENLIPQTCTVPRCGWHFLNDKKIFVDPRRTSTYTEDGREFPLVADAHSQFVKCLTTRGTLENWKRAYILAQSSPVAKFIVAATVAAPLLDVLGGRNFLFFVYSKTRAGKTTALLLGASAVGNEKVMRSFDATKNGLIGVAADLSDYSFLIDEKQVADTRISEQFRALVMALGNGIGRTKLNNDSSVRNTDYWRTIALMTGETPLLDDSANGGAFTRLLQLNAPHPILPPDTCKAIRDIIRENYGHAFPLVLDEISSHGAINLQAMYSKIVASLTSEYQNILPEYINYVSIVTLADFLLNKALGVEVKTAKNNSIQLAHSILNLAPTIEEIDETQREINAVFGFITENQSRFIGGNVTLDKMQKFYGKIMFEDGLIYITVDAMKEACTSHNLNYDRVVADLIDAKVIAVADTVDKGYKEPRKLFVTRLHGGTARCYKLISPFSTSDAE